MRCLPSLFVALCTAVLAAQTEPGAAPAAPEAKAPAPEQAPAAEAPAEKSVGEAAPLGRFRPLQGTVPLGKWAEAKLPEGWRFLAGEQGREFLRELGNQPGNAVLGVALPPDFATSQVFAVYSYADDGHVADDEAPDYAELLASMQEDTRAESEGRRQAGLEPVELLGWAEAPHYDKAQRKLYWALKLKFGAGDDLTLNYNVRVLGRTGHLVVNGVGGMEDLAVVAAHCKTLLQVTEFVDGQRYEQFDPAYDKVAAYGLGGLIAGKLALKAGLFAKLALLLKAFLKPILVGVAVVGGLVWKAVTGRKKAAEAQG